jgi:hypothetical protein
MVQRTGWAVGAVILILSLIGLLGPGPLCNASVSDETGILQIDYPRFPRLQTQTMLRITVQPQRNDAGEATIAINRSYTDAFSIQSITPQPEKATTDDENVVFVFNTVHDQPLRIAVQVTPQRFGTQHARVVVQPDVEVRFTQFVYP